MPQKLVQKRIKVIRDGKPVSPEIGKTFDFTEAELKELTDGQVRDPLNESLGGPSANEHIAVLNSEIARLEKAGQAVADELQRRTAAYNSMSEELAKLQDANANQESRLKEADQLVAEALAENKRLEAENKTLAEAAKTSAAPKGGKAGKAGAAPDNDL